MIEAVMFWNEPNNKSHWDFMELDPEWRIFSEMVRLAAEAVAVVADVKACRVLFEGIARLGGRPAMSPSGNVRVREAMRRERAPLAGEMSGHLFFAECWQGTDDALFAAMRLLDCLGGARRTLAEFRRSLPASAATPELRIPCPDDRKPEVLRQVAERLAAAGARVDDRSAARDDPRGLVALARLWHGAEAHHPLRSGGRSRPRAAAREGGGALAGVRRRAVRAEVGACRRGRGERPSRQNPANATATSVECRANGPCGGPHENTKSWLPGAHPHARPAAALDAARLSTMWPAGQASPR